MALHCVFDAKRVGLTRMILAEWTTAFVVEALAFQVLLAESAIEALAMIVVIQSFYPAITGFNGESTCKAFCCEQFIPIGFAVGITLLQEEWRIAKDFAAMCAAKAFWMEMTADGVQAIALNFAIALAASWRQVLLEAVLAIEITLLLDETDVLQWTTAVAVDANEMIGAPDATQSGDKWTSDLHLAAVALWHTNTGRCGHIQDTTSTLWCRGCAKGWRRFAAWSTFAIVIVIVVIIVVVVVIRIYWSIWAIVCCRGFWQWQSRIFIASSVHGSGIRFTIL